MVNLLGEKQGENSQIWNSYTLQINKYKTFLPWQPKGHQEINVFQALFTALNFQEHFRSRRAC